jgi:hypothetical protein
MPSLQGGTLDVRIGAENKISIALKNDTLVPIYDLTICVKAPGVTNTGKITRATLLDPAGVTSANWALTTPDGQPVPSGGSECVKLTMSPGGNAFLAGGVARLDVDLDGRGERTLSITPTTQEGRVLVGVQPISSMPGALDLPGPALAMADVGQPSQAIPMLNIPADDLVLTAALARRIVIKRRSGGSI